MPDVRLVAWVALGGALGAVLRYLLGAAITRGAFPLGTLAVNVIGSFLLAFLLFHDLARASVTPGMRAFFGIGLLGAFTTMSSLTYETLALYTQGEAGRATLNATLNFALSLAAAVLGRFAAVAVTEGAAA